MITTKVSGFAGQVGKTGLLDTINKPVAEKIPFGRFTAKTTDHKARLPLTNVLLITFSGALVTSNVINLDVNGTAISPVTFASTSNDTLDDICDAIVAVDSGLSAARTGVSHQIEVRATTGTALSIDNIVVTLGAGQATATKVYSSTDGTTTCLGISRMEHKEQDSDGIAQYNLKDIAQIVTKNNAMKVHCEDAFDEDSDIFIRVVEEAGTYKKRGMIRTDAGSPVVAVAFAKGKIRNSGSAGELAEIDILLP